GHGSKAAGDVVRFAVREFARPGRLVIRVPAYGPGGTSPALKVHVLNRAGNAMSELQAVPAPKAGEQQIELPLAAFPPGEYVVEIKAGDQDGDAKELIGFRVTG